MTEAPRLAVDRAGLPPRIHVSGALTIEHAAALERDLDELLREEAPFVFDLGAVETIDTVGAWLLHRASRDQPGSAIEHAPPSFAALLAEVEKADQPQQPRPPEPPFWIGEPARLGRYIIQFSRNFLDAMGFVGLTLTTLFLATKSGRAISWRATTAQMDHAGINALGIVGLMSFLIGIVIAQQGAVQLRQFGAEVFVINLVGRTTFRELGILLTAIMVAGRSASAFAAEIGTMKLREEIDAMRTIGLDPVEQLVLPRVIALVLMLPLLAFFASLLAIIGGGLFSWVSLGIPPASFAERLREVVPMTDFWVGMSKAPMFGAVIAIIGCHQGFLVSGNAESVGQRTTLAVVEAIFAVIVLDAIFAVFYTALGLS